MAPTDAAYGSTVYTAYIFVEQDKKSGIVFADTVTANADEGNVVYEGAGAAPGASASGIKRNPADGSITIAVKFAATGTEADGPIRPDHFLTVAMQAYDLNTGQLKPGTAKEYRMHPGSIVSLTAPNLENMLFKTWKLGPGLKLATGSNQTNETISVEISSNASNCTISAQYVPIAHKVEVNLRDAEGELFQPKGDGEGPTSAEAFIKLEKEYEINPEDLSVEWSPGLPEDDVFAPLTDYTGTVKIDPKSADGKVRVRVKGSSGSWMPIKSDYAFADDFDVSFNGEKGDGKQSVSLDLAPLAVSKTFPKTNHALALVEQPDDISGEPFGADEGAIRALLPSETSVVTKGGFVSGASISWDSVTIAEGSEDYYAAKRWEANGTVELPANIDDGGASKAVSMSVYVDEAPYALSPSASLESGAYLYDQMATLTTNETGGTTYYTLDGSDPRWSWTSEQYQGEPIFISREDATQDELELGEPRSTGRKAIILKAYTEGFDDDKVQGSAISEYEYVFADIPVPQGAELVYDGYPQVGVEWSPFYDLSVEGNGAGGLKIDEEGDAVATNQGTYTVTATLGKMPNCRWEVNDEGVRPEGPQPVKFTIADGSQIDPSTYTVSLKAKLAKGGTVSGGGKYRHGDVVTVNAVPNSGYKFVGWSIAGDVIMSLNTTYTFEIGTSDFELTANFVPISARVFTAKWVDEAGNELDSRPYYHYDGVEDPTYYGEAPTKKADVQYTYRFSRWVGTTTGTVTTFRPEFSKTVNSYKVTFVNHDGSVLQSGNVAYGSLPVYKGPTPAKSDTPNYYYVFKGWTPALTKVTGQATYKATFDTMEKTSQTITAKTTVAKVFQVPVNAKVLDKAKTVDLKKLANVSAKTAVTFQKANKAGGSSIVVAKNGKVTLKKGLKVGAYNLKVRLTAPASSKYKTAKPKVITLKLRIRQK